MNRPTACHIARERGHYLIMLRRRRLFRRTGRHPVVREAEVFPQDWREAFVEPVRMAQRAFDHVRFATGTIPPDSGSDGDPD